MKKLWTVTFEAELVVYAETQDEATKYGERYRRDAQIDHVHTLEMGKRLPYGWEEDCVPYGEADLSIKDILALQTGSAEK